MSRTTVLAFCGSLRLHSLNRSLLRAIELSAPDFRFVGGDLIGDLPLFNADLTGALLPAPVREFRLLASAARGAVIVSPEYVHGPSGVTKNALDWLTDSIGLFGKPVLLASASPGQTGGIAGTAALVPSLQLLGAQLLDPMTVSRATTRLRDDGEVDDPALAARIAIAVEELRCALMLLPTPVT
jgi:chromate reductase, NAD(P)H dehydrogenase (quinone)